MRKIDFILSVSDVQKTLLGNRDVIIW